MHQSECDKKRYVQSAQFLLFFKSLIQNRSDVCLIAGALRNVIYFVDVAPRKKNEQKNVLVGGFITNMLYNSTALTHKNYLCLM